MKRIIDPWDNPRNLVAWRIRPHAGIKKNNQENKATPRTQQIKLRKKIKKKNIKLVRWKHARRNEGTSGCPKQKPTTTTKKLEKEKLTKNKNKRQNNKDEERRNNIKGERSLMNQKNQEETPKRGRKILGKKLGENLY